MRILVTGVAGFIGMHVAMRLLADGHEVIGLDNINDYYDVRLKQARLAHIGSPNQFHFHKLDLADRDGITSLFADAQPEIVINLAAQAGVRYSLQNPHSYIDSNLVGFTNILEACRHFDVGHLVYASSSSVYGLNEEMPFHEGQNTDHPLALYGATKKANELLAHSYSNLFNLPTTGLRLFTVYGPWGRPDMAPMLFADAILNHRPIKVFNHGQMKRDFTYIDDIVEGVVRTAMKPATPNADFDTKVRDSASSEAPFRVFNIGNGQPVPLMNFINALEEALGQNVEKEFMEMQPGDVAETFADTKRLRDWVGHRPKTDIHTGVSAFVDWYLANYHHNQA
jgi:UDP-glucuronate 4-epimerase